MSLCLFVAREVTLFEVAATRDNEGTHPPTRKAEVRRYRSSVRRAVMIAFAAQKAARANHTIPSLRFL